MDITIADDETASTSISLSVSPHSVAEGAAATSLTITATLDGKVLDTDAVVTVSVDPASQATRDVDYRMLFNPRLTIAAGAVSGSIDGLIEPLADDEEEDNESITLNGVIDGLTDGTGQLIITDVAMMDDDDDDGSFGLRRGYDDRRGRSHRWFADERCGAAGSCGR